MKKIQNQWDAAGATAKGKFIAIQSYTRKKEKSQTTLQLTNNLNLHLKQVGKKTKQNPKLIEGKKSK